MELADNFPSMGRFTLRDEGKTIAMGVIKKIIEWNEHGQENVLLSRKSVIYFRPVDQSTVKSRKEHFARYNLSKSSLRAGDLRIGHLRAF